MTATVVNGDIPPSQLRPIAGGGYLVPEAAASWNAMAAFIVAKTGERIAPAGPDSSYRPLPVQQHFWDLYQSGQGNLAAEPGTSNHGWGLAVDLGSPRMRELVDLYGAQFGWSKAWSDAPSEWWHLRYTAGHWSGRDPGPGYTGSGSADHYPTLKRGDHGGAVKRAQSHLRRWNLGGTRPDPDGTFGRNTGDAVREFQKIHGLDVDGVIGKGTWAKLRSTDTLTAKERTAVNRAKLLSYGGIADHERDQWKRLVEWLEHRAAWIKSEAAKHGWDKLNRRTRFVTLKNTANRK